MLNEQQIDNCQRDSFLMTKDFVSYEVHDALLTRACDMAAELEPATYHTFFVTTDQARTSAEHLLDSEGELHRDKAVSLNKVGHALHALNLLFD